mgnify:CR=1 FL=1
MNNNFMPEKFLDLQQTMAKNLFKNINNVWEVIPNINMFIKEIGENLSNSEYYSPQKNVWISKNAKVSETAHISEFTIIEEGTEIRHCAFIRGNAIIGKNCVVGNSTEIKNVILFNNVQVPHYNYVGDSILGYKAHMGAGAITSNVRADKNLISFNFNNKKIETNLKKFGAILGDYTEIGCNAVLNPGSIVGKNSNIYPLTMVRGYIPENSIVKNNGNIVTKI